MGHSISSRFMFLSAFAALGAGLPIGAYAQVVDSVTIVPGSLTQGSVKASLGSGTSYASEGVNLSDWPLNTGGSSSSTYAISLENPDFNGNSFGGNANTIVAFGYGGGVTLKFNTPITPQTGEKDLGIFTAQAVTGGSGSYALNGNMEASILVSSDGISWYTLTGTLISNYTTYTGTLYNLNAPTMAYNFGTGAIAWKYGAGTSAANLAALTVANYTTPMPDDSIFNSSTSTNAQRLAFTTDTSASDYAAIFGNSGGGNWFDISGSGLGEINFVRLNGGPDVPSSGGIRLDAVFANSNAVLVGAAVPEPASMGLLACGGMLLLKRRRQM